MYVEPNTNVRLLNNVKLNNDYKHTINFKNQEEQTNYFLNKTWTLLQKQTYQRVKNGVFRCGTSADSVYNCNYMMFQNTSWSNKWFYAFILSIEYVNNVMCEITFEIDVWQTWRFHINFGTCYLKRNHTVSDMIGEHTEPEDLETGDYQISEYDDFWDALNDMKVVIQIANAPQEGGLYDGVYSGSIYVQFESSSHGAIDDFLSSYLKTPEEIVSIYLVPKQLLPSGEGEIHGGTTAKTFNMEGTALSTRYTFGGYSPQNMKLYSYPYTYCHVDNHRGDVLRLPYEYFNDGLPKFQITGTITSPVQMTMRPIHYRDFTGHECGDVVITQEGYPLCSWVNDTYKAWQAQSAVPSIMKGLASLGVLVYGLRSGSINNFAALAGGVSTATNVATSLAQGSFVGASIQGNIDSGNVNIAHRTQTFFHGRAHIRYEFAKKIDDYFTRYGYAVNTLDTGAWMNHRPHWTYVEMNDVEVFGLCPNDDLVKIRNILLNGITFWNNGDEIGNFTLNNKPT